MEGELSEALKYESKKGFQARQHLPSPLKNLGRSAIKLLLHIFNISFTTGNIPQVLRNANIISLLNANKPPFDLGYFRLVNLQLNVDCWKG